MLRDRFLVAGLLGIAACGASGAGSTFESVTVEDAGSEVGSGGGFINVPFDAGAEAEGASVAEASAVDAQTNADSGRSESKGTCSSLNDCRLFSNYCGGCTCEILGKDYPDPVCNGTPVACKVDPCMGKLRGCVVIQHVCFIPEL